MIAYMHVGIASSLSIPKSKVCLFPPQVTESSWCWSEMHATFHWSPSLAHTYPTFSTARAITAPCLAHFSTLIKRGWVVKDRWDSLCTVRKIKQSLYTCPLIPFSRSLTNCHNHPTLQVSQSEDGISRIIYNNTICLWQQWDKNLDKFTLLLSFRVKMDNSHCNLAWNPCKYAKNMWQKSNGLIWL